MADKKTVRETSDPSTNPVSRVENRVISRGTAISAELDGRMILARRTLTAFVLEARNATPKLKSEFVITDVGKLGVSSVENLDLNDDKNTNTPAFTLSFEYRGREDLTHVCQSDAVFKKLRKMLYDAGLKFRTATGATVNKITIEPKVPASVTLAADADTGFVVLTLRNVTVLGTIEYELPPDRLDSEFIEAIGALIASHSNSFYVLASAVSKPRRY
jgi:hypothetical protein